MDCLTVLSFELNYMNKKVTNICSLVCIPLRQHVLGVLKLKFPLWVLYFLVFSSPFIKLPKEITKILCLLFHDSSSNFTYDCLRLF